MPSVKPVVMPVVASHSTGEKNGLVVGTSPKVGVAGAVHVAGSSSRKKKAAIDCRVMVAVGRKVPSVKPVVMPVVASHSTASKNGLVAGTSEKLGVAGGVNPSGAT